MSFIIYIWFVKPNGLKEPNFTIINKNKKYIENYKIIGSNDILPLVESYSIELKKIWDKIPLENWIIKVDLGKLLYIYYNGGIYLDVDCLINKNFTTLFNEDTSILLFIETILKNEKMLGPRECKNPENKLRLSNYAFASNRINHSFIKELIDECIFRLNILFNSNNNNNNISSSDILWVCGPDVISTIYHKSKNNYTDIKLLEKNYLNHLSNGSWRENIKINSIKPILKRKIQMVGSSNENIKFVNLDDDIFKNNNEKQYTFKLIKNKYKDTFNFEIKNNQLIVTRTDMNEGWGYKHSVIIDMVQDNIDIDNSDIKKSDIKPNISIVNTNERYSRLHRDQTKRVNLSSSHLFKNEPPTKETIIPLNIFQTWSTHDLLPEMKQATELLKENNPEFNYYLYDDEECLNFIKENFDESVANSYLSLIPGSYKADLWRLCILYIFGGVYIDIKIMPNNNFKLINLMNKEYFVLERPGFWKKETYGLWNGFMICKPKNTILLASINRIVDNVKNQNYDYNFLYPTGPGLLGEIFFKDKNENYSFDLFVYYIKNKCNIVYNGNIILKEYDNYRVNQGIQEKTDYYTNLYNNRNIYNKEIIINE